MARVKKSEVREKLEAWAALQRQIQKAEQTRDRKLAPLIADHNEETKPILAKFESRATPLREKAAKLEAEIKTLVENDRDGQGNPKPIVITSELATVSVTKKDGSRVIRVREFFEAVKDKGQEFYESINVLVGKAEKLLGKKTIDEISDKPPTFETTVKLN